MTMPITTTSNPLVRIWDSAESKDYDYQGILGSMHLSTAAHIHDFKIDSNIAEELAKVGTGERLEIVEHGYHTDKIFLEYHDRNSEEIEKSPMNQMLEVLE